MNTITEISTNDRVTIATYIDLSKAFNCQQYDQLFVKMKALGFEERTLNWYALTKREQSLKKKMVQLGVPQGTILRPILFLIYITDMSNADTATKFIKFADDTTILTDGATLEKAVTMINESLCKADLLNIYPAKTTYMIFNSKSEETNLVKIRDQFIETVREKGIEKSFKLVGINIDEKLKWTEHIKAVGRKINSANYALTKAYKELNVKKI